MPKTRRRNSSRTRRPRILRYRWWLLARSRRGTGAALVFLVAVLVVVFAARGRMSAQPSDTAEAFGTPPN